MFELLKQNAGGLWQIQWHQCWQIASEASRCQTLPLEWQSQSNGWCGMLTALVGAHLTSSDATAAAASWTTPVASRWWTNWKSVDMIERLPIHVWLVTQRHGTRSVANIAQFSSLNVSSSGNPRWRRKLCHNTGEIKCYRWRSLAGAHDCGPAVHQQIATADAYRCGYLLMCCWAAVVCRLLKTSMLFDFTRLTCTNNTELPLQAYIGDWIVPTLLHVVQKNTKDSGKIS